MANWADKDKFYRNQHQKVKRGQIVTSQQSLADRWKWSRRQVRTYLRNLNESNMVTIKSTRNYTTITIVNYAIYQDARPTDGPTNGQRKTNRRPTDDQQTTTQEESKEEKKERRERAASAAMVSPSLEEVISYQEESGIDVDPEAFWDYYEGNGWMRGDSPIRNWKAVMRGWVGKPVYRENRTAGGIDLDKLQLTEAFYDPE